MLNFTFFFLFFNSLIFLHMNHPMSMGLILLIQTILTFLMTGQIMKNFWFSYILFLIFIGGMLVLFIYMASLSSNEKFNLMKKKIPLIFFIMMIALFMMFFHNSMMNFFQLMSSEYHNFFNEAYLMKENFLINSKIFNNPNNFIILFLINYLLLNLIIIVKITNQFEGPLRLKTN